MKATGSEEREKAISEFVTSLWRRGEHDTQPDRDRWSTSLDLFAGKQTWTGDREPWQSKPFIHQLAPIVRRMAEGSSDIIFDKENFLEYEAREESDVGAVKLSKIFSKVLGHYNDRARIQSVFYDFLVALGTCGFSILKVTPEQRVVFTGDVILEKIEKQKRKIQKGLAKKVTNDFTTIPEDDASVESLLSDEMDAIFGAGVTTNRKLGPKKKYELFITTKIVNPLNFVIEPDCQRVQETPYTIERHFVKLHEIQGYFESGFFDKSKRKKISGSTFLKSGSSVNVNSTYEGQKINLRDQLEDQSKFAKTLTLYEYYGDWWDEKGQILEENKHFVIANETLLLRDADIDAYDQKSPYILVTCAPKPFKAVGAGVADNSIDQQVLTNDLFGTFMDMFKLAIYPPRFFDETAVRDADELESDGVAPGQFIRAFKPAKEAVSDLTSTGVNVGPMLLQILQYLDITGEKGAAVDVQSSNPASRARISAKEIQSNVARSGQSQNAMARNLDENLLEPYAHAIADIILQYGLEPDNLKQLAEEAVITGEEYALLKNIPPIERYLEAKKKLKIRVRGFRERIERVQKLGSVADMISLIPQLPQQAVQKIDFSQMLPDLFDLFGFDSDRWIYQNDPADKAREENTLLLNGQMVGIGQADDHAAELVTHYEAVLQGMNPAVGAHLQAHIQSLLAAGLPVPPMSEEVQQALGIGQASPAPTPPTKRTLRAKRGPDGSIEGEVSDVPQLPGPMDVQ